MIRATPALAHQAQDETLARRMLVFLSQVFPHALLSWPALLLPCMPTPGDRLAQVVRRTLDEGRVFMPRTESTQRSHLASPQALGMPTDRVVGQNRRSRGLPFVSQTGHSSKSHVVKKPRLPLLWLRWRHEAEWLIVSSHVQGRPGASRPHLMRPVC